MKDPNCPNCGGRSYSATDPSDYYVCQLCERPDPAFVEWYKSKWPDAYRKWKEATPA